MLDLGVDIGFRISSISVNASLPIVDLVNLFLVGVLLPVLLVPSVSNNLKIIQKCDPFIHLICFDKRLCQLTLCPSVLMICCSG